MRNPEGGGYLAANQEADKAVADRVAWNEDKVLDEWEKDYEATTAAYKEHEKRMYPEQANMTPEERAHQMSEQRLHAGESRMKSENDWGWGPAGPKNTYEQLEKRVGKITSLLEKMSIALASGDERSENLEKRIDFVLLRAKAEAEAYSSRPEYPGKLGVNQGHYEDAASRERTGILVLKYKKRILLGEVADEDLAPKKLFQLGFSDNQIREIRAEAELKSLLQPEEVKKLASDTEEAIRQLEALTPEIVKMAKDNSFSPEEKEEKLMRYGEMYQRYMATKEDLMKIVRSPREIPENEWLDF